jgi:hypothetical protein
MVASQCRRRHAAPPPTPLHATPRRPRPGPTNTPPTPPARPAPWLPCSFTDAVKECGKALELAPTSTKALRHRARAYEQQSLFKQALNDIQVCV